MGLFSKKKAEVIPEVGGGSKMRDIKSGRPESPAPPSLAPSYRSHAPSYVPPSQGGQGYNNHNHYARPQQPQQQGSYGPPGGHAGGPAQGQSGGGDRYGGGGGGGGDRYGRPQHGAYGSSAARDELLSGAPQQSRGGGQGSSSYGASGQEDAYGGQQSQEYNEEDEEVEGIKQQMRFVKQESLASTRNAVRIAREAEETARATLDKLGDQSGESLLLPGPTQGLAS